MFPGQLDGDPQLVFVVLLFTILAVPVLVGLIAVLNGGGSRTDERLSDRVAELERRVTELEARLDDDGDDDATDR